MIFRQKSPLIVFFLRAQLCRRRKDRDERARRRRLKAARIIQNFSRGAFARTAYELLVRKRLAERRAALQIESAARRWAAYRRVAILRAETKRRVACEHVQRVYRGATARQRVLELRSQTFVHGALVRKLVAAALLRRAAHLREERDAERARLLAREKELEAQRIAAAEAAAAAAYDSPSGGESAEVATVPSPEKSPPRPMVPAPVLCELCALRAGVLGPTAILAAWAEGTKRDVPPAYFEETGRCDTCGNELVLRPRAESDEESHQSTAPTLESSEESLPSEDDEEDQRRRAVERIQAWLRRIQSRRRASAACIIIRSLHTVRQVRLAGAVVRSRRQAVFTVQRTARRYLAFKQVKIRSHFRLEELRKKATPLWDRHQETHRAFAGTFDALSCAVPSSHDFWGLCVTGRSPPPPGCVSCSRSAGGHADFDIGERRRGVEIRPPLAALGPSLPCWLSDCGAGV